MTGILFVARLGSTRLSNKHLIEVEGKTFVEWLVLRYAHEFKNEIENGTVKLIIATSHRPENKKFESVLKNIPVAVFYGNDENIPQRQVECGEHFHLKNIISIDGDDVLCSTNAARKIYNKLTIESHVLAKTSGLPFGMNAMGYSLDFLRNAVSENHGKLETGWGRIFDTNLMQDIILGNYANNNDLRFTLDYDLDADFFKTVISALKNETVSISDEKLIQTVMENKFYEINKSLSEQYWANFNKEKNSELNQQ